MAFFSCRYARGARSMTGELPDTVQITGNELKVLKVDDAVNVTFVCEVKNRIGLGKDQVTAFVRGEWYLPMRLRCVVLKELSSH